MLALDGSNLGRAQDLLNRQRPQPGQKDLRGWEWRYLWRQTHSDALSTLCQKSEIESLAASADGNWLAIGLVHKDGLFVYDLQDRQEVAHLAPGEREVRAAFSSAASLLAFTIVSVQVSGKSRYTYGFGVQPPGRMVSDFPLDGFCTGLAFAKDGRTLVTSTKQGNVSLWRIPEGTNLASFPNKHAGLFQSTDFAATSDLGLAAYGAGSGEVRVMDLHDGKELWSAVASKLIITALAFSPDGKTLASAAGWGESDIRLWDADHRRGNRAAERPEILSPALWCSGRMASNWPPAARWIRRFGFGT